MKPKLRELLADFSNCEIEYLSSLWYFLKVIIGAVHDEYVGVRSVKNRTTKAPELKAEMNFRF